MPVFFKYLCIRCDELLIRNQAGKYIQIDLDSFSYCVLDPVRSHVLGEPKYAKAKYISKSMKAKIQSILDNPKEIYFDAVED